MEKVINAVIVVTFVFCRRGYFATCRCVPVVSDMHFPPAYAAINHPPQQRFIRSAVIAARHLGIDGKLSLYLLKYFRCNNPGINAIRQLNGSSSRILFGINVSCPPPVICFPCVVTVGKDLPDCTAVPCSVSLARRDTHTG